MKKADLRTGMILKHEDGELGMVLLGTNNGDIVSGEAWYPLGEMSEELEGNLNDIIEVYQPQYNQDYLHKGLSTEGCDLLWKREEAVEMTLEQVCEALGMNVKIVKG